MSVHITDRAKTQLLDSLKEEKKSTDTHHLRVGVLSGGCSGLQYFMGRYFCHIFGRMDPVRKQIRVLVLIA